MCMESTGFYQKTPDRDGGSTSVSSNNDTRPPVKSTDKEYQHYTRGPSSARCKEESSQGGCSQ